ncbi:hypothetical protein [Luteimonas abyssi]|uniref:hypothetical protein n=1 Tax=Luteimonas abyssi TaxID=1247514 RepID=UPI0012F82AD7|nr:hypothetical protein [Luteimonas abyssi]
MSAWLVAAFMGLAACAGWSVGRWAAYRKVGRAIAAGRRARLAEQQSANGEVLLEMASRMERHARALERIGLPAQEPSAWARACRAIAVQHLACVNALLIETGLDVVATSGPGEHVGRRGAGTSGASGDASVSPVRRTRARQR